MGAEGEDVNQKRKAWLLARGVQVDSVGCRLGPERVATLLDAVAAETRVDEREKCCKRACQACRDGVDIQRMADGEWRHRIGDGWGMLCHAHLIRKAPEDER